MADQSTKTRRQPSRLQRRAPALIQVAPVGHWNVAIPLLSPLATSPDEKMNHHVDNNNSSSKEENSLNRRVVNGENKEPEKVPIVYKKWQHPAAPFYYESAPPLLQSVCSAGIVDMS